MDGVSLALPHPLPSLCVPGCVTGPSDLPGTAAVVASLPSLGESIYRDVLVRLRKTLQLVMTAKYAPVKVRVSLLKPAILGRQ